MADPVRPHLVVVVAGTGTEVGKTWVGAELIGELRVRRLVVAARKPAQSFEPGDVESGITDAQLLAAASGEDSLIVCPEHRRYDVAMAPPMAADVLGRPAVLIDDLASEVAASWPGRAPDVGLVELAGGVRSPAAEDGDGVTLSTAVGPDLVLVVADAGLGTINAVRMTVEALAADVAAPVVVHLNRYDPEDDLHRRNRAWLVDRDGFEVTASIAELADAVTSRLARYCVDCGCVETECAGSHGPLEAPRYCPTCGRRMAVTIIPTGHRSVCRTHGEPTPA